MSTALPSINAINSASGSSGAGGAATAAGAPAPAAGGPTMTVQQRRIVATKAKLERVKQDREREQTVTTSAMAFNGDYEPPALVGNTQLNLSTVNSSATRAAQFAPKHSSGQGGLGANHAMPAAALLGGGSTGLTADPPQRFDMQLFLEVYDAFRGQCRLLGHIFVLWYNLVSWKWPLATVPAFGVMVLIALNPKWIPLTVALGICFGLAAEYVRSVANIPIPRDESGNDLALLTVSQENRKMELSRKGALGDLPTPPQTLKQFRKTMRGLQHELEDVVERADELVALLTWKDPKLTGALLTSVGMTVFMSFLVNIEYMVLAAFIFPFLVNMEFVKSFVIGYERRRMMLLEQGDDFYNPASPDGTEPASPVELESGIPTPTRSPIEISSDELSAKRSTVHRSDDATSVVSSVRGATATGDHCSGCGNSFNLLRKKHCCPHCGNDYCKKCCHREVTRAFLGATAPAAYEETVRVCERCFVEMSEFQQQLQMTTPRK